MTNTTNPLNNPVIDYYGNKRWYNKGDQRHRIDGPAFIGTDGRQVYWVNNKLHRIGGPADSAWPQEYWIDGKRVTKLEHDLLYDLMKLKGLI